MTTFKTYIITPRDIEESAILWWAIDTENATRHVSVPDATTLPPSNDRLEAEFQERHMMPEALPDVNIFGDLPIRRS